MAIKTIKTDRGTDIFIGEIMPANYTESFDPMFRHNRLIETLPPLLSHDDMMEATRWHPVVVQDLGALSDSHRAIAVERLGLFVEPLEQYKYFYDRIMGQILTGYLNRNPSKAELQKALQDSFPSKKFLVGLHSGRMPRVSRGFSVLGLSGVGKTLMVEDVLSLLPQVYAHGPGPNCDNNAFHQITWIKLLASHTGSMRDLAFDFFITVDTLTGSSYYEEFREFSEAQLIAQMGIVARNHFVGVLVIDEIQDLRARAPQVSIKKNRPKTPSYPPTLLKTLVHICNEINCPVVFVGTPDAEPMLGMTMPLARRSTESGVLRIPRFMRGAEWDNLLDTLQPYQFLLKKVNLKADVGDVLYECSQGIIHYLIRLLMLAQWEAIYTKQEKITRQTIINVANDHLGPALRWLDLIARGFENSLEEPGTKEKMMTWSDFVQRREKRMRLVDVRTDEHTAESKAENSRSAPVETLKDQKKISRDKQKNMEKNRRRLEDQGILADKPSNHG